MDQPTCKSCPYFARGRQGFFDGLARINRDQGYCMRHAPQPVMVRDDDTMRYFAAWPAVWDFAWCGDHIEFPAYLDQLRRARTAAPVKPPTAPGP
jgi:hypothetical protein